MKINIEILESSIVQNLVSKIFTEERKYEIVKEGSFTKITVKNTEIPFEIRIDDERTTLYADVPAKNLSAFLSKVCPNLVFTIS